ncbi:MAG: energy transducer TonB [Sulfuricaulis sp.]
MMIDGTAEAISQGRRPVPDKFIFLRPPYLLGAVMILLLAAGVYAILRTVLTPAPPKMQQVVQQISLLPPPPPPPVEQPPQPEVKQQVPLPAPAPATHDNAPPPGNLGLDADANGGSDGFALQARRGGRDLLDAGGPFGWFSNRVQETIYKALSANKTIRGMNYNVNLNLWLNHDGHIERVELVDSTGNAALDRSIKLAVAEVGSIGNELPADLPQPVRLKIDYRH